jgi:hypothetical protein
MIPRPLEISGYSTLGLFILTALLRKYITFFPVNFIFFISFLACINVFFIYYNLSAPIWNYLYFLINCNIFALYLGALTSLEGINMQGNIFFMLTANIFAY